MAYFCAVMKARNVERNPKGSGVGKEVAFALLILPAQARITSTEIFLRKDSLMLLNDNALLRTSGQCKA